MLAKIKDILIITSPSDNDDFKKLLGSGKELGINISYSIQEKPKGIAESFLIGSDFIKKSNVCLILGDNIFYGQNLGASLQKISKRKNGATLFAYHVNDPHRFGVVDFNNKNIITSLEEKPKKPKTNYAVTGLYFYDNSVIEKAKKLKPSKRGELEITDLNKMYLKEKKLKVEFLSRGSAWLDTGTHESLLEASQFVQIVENRQGLKIACLEEISYNNKWITKKSIIKKIKLLNNSLYGNYLKRLLENK